MLRVRILPIVWLPAVVMLGCQAGTDALRLWAVDDMVQLTELTAPSAPIGGIWDADGRTVRLFAAANETVSFQLVLDAPAQGLAGVSVACERLRTPGNSLPPDAVRLFRMLPVQIGEYPSWHHRLADAAPAARSLYDVLVPAGGPSIAGLSLRPNQRLALWVDVTVPRDALSGEYGADIHVRHFGGHKTLRLSLKVYDFVLPDIRPVPCLGGFSYKTIFREFVRQAGPGGEPAAFVPDWLDTSNRHVRSGLVVIRELMRLGHEHRLDLFDKEIRPVIKRDAQGKVVLQWAEYDSIVKPYLDGTAFDDRLGVAAWPAPVSSRWPDPDDYGGPAAARYRQTLAAAVGQTVDHFRDLQMTGKLFAWLRTGDAGPASYVRHGELAQVVRLAGDVPLLSELPPAPPPASTWATPDGFPRLADMYAPPADLVALASAPELARKAEPLTGLYLRPGRPPFVGSCGVLSWPADVRALAWIVMKYRCAGIFFPETLNWQGDPYRAAGGEDRLFYPYRPAMGPEAAPGRGGSAVLGSVRLKWLRRGLQDSAYLWLLRQRGRGAVADALINTMVHYAGGAAAGDHYQDGRLDGWVRHGSSWLAARRLLAEEIYAAIHPDGVNRENLLAQRVAWQKLQRSASRIRIERIRTRFELLPKGRYRAVCRVELYNELALAAEVQLRMATLPQGFGASSPAGRVTRLAPATGAAVELTAEGDHVRTGAAAKMMLPLVMNSQLRGIENIPAEAPFLLVGYTDRQLTIDGSLRDWPMRRGNRAADFRLLGCRGWAGGPSGPGQIQTNQAGDNGRDGLAKRQTAVFALHNGKTLYLAFRCEEPALAKLVGRPTNIIRYQQHLAVGEDLVEVIVDPGVSAGDPAGLYRLVVKCNGVIVSQRGLGADPPLGPARPWPVDAKVAIGAHDGCWIVELAVPLAAFGQAAEAPVWGVNFTRFATARPESSHWPEASSWAGAARYYYHPRNLGTMYLVPKDAQLRFETTQPAGPPPQGD